MTAPGVAETLERIGPDLRALDEDWWLIGSAALVLHGVGLDAIDDVDVLTTPVGARRLAKRWGLDAAPGTPSDRFRSQVFVKRLDTPLKVEVMAGFQVKTGAVWTDVWPKTRIETSGGFLTPSRSELLEILALFGRPKDLARAALLRAL